MENIIKKLFHSYKKQADLDFARIKLDFSPKYRIEEIIFKDGRKRYFPQRSNNHPRCAGTEDYCTIIFCKCEIEQYKYTGEFNTVDNNGYHTYLCRKNKCMEETPEYFDSEELALQIIVAYKEKIEKENKEEEELERKRKKAEDEYNATIKSIKHFQVF